jgi:hypothetical protein
MASGKEISKRSKNRKREIIATYPKAYLCNYPPQERGKYIYHKRTAFPPESTNHGKILAYQ